MKIENQEQLDTFLETWEDISERAANIATSMLKLQGVKNAVVTDEDIRIECGTFYAEYEEYQGCNNWETHTVRIPDEYFFDENFLVDAQKEIDKKKAEEKRLQAARAEEAIRKKKEADRAQYLKLKEQFG